jgi:DNA-binding CsgD family transcriptional regulator
MKQTPLQIRPPAFPHNAPYLSDPIWIAHQVERLELLLPEASHTATHDLLACALAYVERYEDEVLQLEHAWEFLYAALISAWQQSQHAIVVRLVSSLAHLVCRPSTSVVAEHILHLGIGASRRIQDREHLTCFLNRLGCLLFSRGKYSRGWRIWCKSLELAGASGSSLGLWEPLSSFVYIADMLGSYEAAQHFVESLQRTRWVDDSDTFAVAVFVRGFFARITNNPEKAHEDFNYSLRLLSLQTPGTPPSSYRLLFSMAVQTELARVQGNYTRSQALAETTLSLAQLFGDYYTVVELLIDHGLFTFQQKQFVDTQEVFLRLRDLIQLSEAEHLLERCRRLEQQMNEYLPAWRTLASNQDQLIPAIVSSGIQEPLSQREIEVLQLVADGLSNQEIAGHLVITSATVKKHLEHIYSKLDVHSRTSAIARARIHKLFP